MSLGQCLYRSVRDRALKCQEKQIVYGSARMLEGGYISKISPLPRTFEPIFIAGLTFWQWVG